MEKGRLRIITLLEAKGQSTQNGMKEGSRRIPREKLKKIKPHVSEGTKRKICISSKEFGGEKKKSVLGIYKIK